MASVTPKSASRSASRAGVLVARAAAVPPAKLATDQLAVSLAPGSAGVSPASSVTPGSILTERKATRAPLGPLRRILERLRGAIFGPRPVAGPAVPVPVAALPGGLDRTLMLNSNHPEKLLGPGIAVSTLPWPGEAHLGRAFTGDFRLFAHHNNASGRTLHQAVALFNPGPNLVTVKIGPSASFSTREAPYRDTHDDAAADPGGKLTSGPGDATAAAVLRGDRAIPAKEIVLLPGKVTMLHTKEVPARNEVTSTFVLEASGPVHAAVVFDDAPPTAESVTARLGKGDRVPRNPEDKPPTPPGQPGQVIFGRVAGIQEGATWSATITNDVAKAEFAIGESPLAGGVLLVGKRSNTLGTGQDQAAPLAHRYPDAAYSANGNYGVEYVVDLPAVNRSARSRTLRLHFDTPTPAQGLSRAFRGMIEITTTRLGEKPQTSYVHLNQRAGDYGAQPLSALKLAPGESRNIRVRLVYPADATPPHVLRIQA